LLGRFGALLVGGIAFALIFSGIFRRYLFFRLCKNATGNGSFLVFIPVLRWIALTEAARMSKQLLLVPTFATVALFLPPPFVQKVPWAAMAYVILVAVLWFATLLLYILWCVRICLNSGRSAGWALFMMFPLFDYVALIVLAFSEPKADASPAIGPVDQIKGPALAI
jgi:hypothetical protein